MSLRETVEDFLRHAEDGRITREKLAPMVRMAPSALDQESEEAAILRSLLMGEDGATTSINRHATLLAILEIAGKTENGKAGDDASEKITEGILRWWWMDNAPEGPHARIHLALEEANDGPNPT